MHKVTRDEIDEHVADLQKFKEQLNGSIKKVAQMTNNKNYVRTPERMRLNACRQVRSRS